MRWRQHHRRRNQRIRRRRWQHLAGRQHLAGFLQKRAYHVLVLPVGGLRRLESIPQVEPGTLQDPAQHGSRLGLLDVEPRSIEGEPLALSLGERRSWCERGECFPPRQPARGRGGSGTGDRRLRKSRGGGRGGDGLEGHRSSAARRASPPRDDQGPGSGRRGSAGPPTR